MKFPKARQEQMGTAHQEEIMQFQSVMEDVDDTLKHAFENVHQGYPTETLICFLKARDWNVQKAHKLLINCLQWRIQNEIDKILEKPIIPIDSDRAIQDSQLVVLSGYSKEGLPVIAFGVGLSACDKASVNDYVQSYIHMNEYRDRVILPSATEKSGKHFSTCLMVLDMTGLKLSALSQIKLLTAITTTDDLNYPEKTETYYIVNAPYIFSACWKVVRPLLQGRTNKKIHSFKIMDDSSLPHFCRKEGSRSCRHNEISPRQFPEPDSDDAKIAETIESELHRLGDQNGVLKVNGD